MCSAVVFTIEENLRIIGPVRFKAMLFKGQLCKYPSRVSQLIGTETGFEPIFIQLQSSW